MSTTESTTETPAETLAEETPAQPQEAAEQQQQTEGTEDDQQDNSKASKQAAKYRRQLRETEAERDTLQSTVGTLRTAIAEAALENVLAKPSALWMTGASPADFYDDAGNLDTEALHTAAREATEAHGLQSHKRFQGGADGGAREDSQPPRQFADMFKPKSR